MNNTLQDENLIVALIEKWKEFNRERINTTRFTKEKNEHLNVFQVYIHDSLQIIS